MPHFRDDSAQYNQPGRTGADNNKPLGFVGVVDALTPAKPSAFCRARAARASGHRPRRDGRLVVTEVKNGP
jgi:hypothetical protein